MRVVSGYLAFDWLERKLQQYSNRDLNKRDSIKMLCLYYVRVLVAPYKFNLLMVGIIGLSIYSDAAQWLVITQILLIVALPVKPLVNMILIGLAYKKGRLEAESGKTYNNTYRYGSEQHSAYSESYYKVKS
ncbi:hypothetical protein [uncultured Pseudoalteromonas sp.]|jgi:hypothetical protein|uniref:hypothetical protein n=1 Tax=uncultured Pseudoalteromonas sp. TaxID=114053 RepID=UPI002593F2D3|nr:hypothetical protein [uncultured Pseudoalteromonas sp.]